MTKQVKICLAVVITVVVAAIIAAVFVSRPPESENVEIIQNGNMIKAIDLANSDNQKFRIETDGGWNEIIVEDGKIWVSDANCPDKTCVKTGVLRSAGVPIVCLPHKLVIRYGDDRQNGENE